MSQWTAGAERSFPCSIAIPIHARVILSAGALAIAGANDTELGCVTQACFVPTYGVAPFNAPVRLRTAQGTTKYIATGAIAQGANVYADANGGVTATVGPVKIGTALFAASANGDIIEVLRGGSSAGDIGGGPVSAPIGGLRVVQGQLATGTAADTVATGLTTVLRVVASLESDPVLTAEWVTAQVGNQTGAPAAGSIVIKTWEATSNANPTPIAATTFGKLVNWIAIGY